MPFEKPISIATGNLTEMVAKSVESALRLRLEPDRDFVGFDLRRSPWILGFILRDLSRVSDISVATLTKTADRISANIEGPTVSAVLIRDGSITVGFYPEVEIDAVAIGR